MACHLAKTRTLGKKVILHQGGSKGGHLFYEGSRRNSMAVARMSGNVDFRQNLAISLCILCKTQTSLVLFLIWELCYLSQSGNVCSPSQHCSERENRWGLIELEQRGRKSDPQGPDGQQAGSKCSTTLFHPFPLRTAAETGVTDQQVAEALMILLPILNLGSLGLSQIDVVSLHSSAGQKCMGRDVSCLNTRSTHFSKGRSCCVLNAPRIDVCVCVCFFFHPYILGLS